MQIKVDASDAIRDAERQVKQLDRFPASAERRIRRAVDQERSGHRFKNRTGNAEGSMDVEVANGGDSVTIVAEMGAEYASYLTKKNFTRFDERVERALEEIEAEAAKLGSSR